MTTIDAPAELKWHSYDLGRIDTMAEVRSIYTGAARRLDYGGGWWTMTLTTRDQTQAHASVLEAWADRLRAVDAVMRFGPLPGYVAQGTTAATTLTATAARSAGAVSLGVTGLGAGLTIAAGSYVSVADHLHRVQTTIAGGSADPLLIWPPLREDMADAATIEIADGVRSLWRLQGVPARGAVSDRAHLLAPVSLSLVEAI